MTDHPERQAWFPVMQHTSFVQLAYIRFGTAVFFRRDTTQAGWRQTAQKIERVDLALQKAREKATP